MTTPSKEAIEAAADVIWMRANSENGVCGADRQTHSYAVANEVATAALTAAYPLTEAQAKAEALREAAEQVHDSHTGLDANGYERGFMQRHNRNRAADWLRARAAAIAPELTP